MATRVIIATQEPTLSPSLLDLCNVTIVHHFDSPHWFETLKHHLAGVAINDSNHRSAANSATLFSRIVGLRRGEALVFCPTANADIEVIEYPENKCSRQGNNSSRRNIHLKFCYLESRYLKLRIRRRVTTDGGQSIVVTSPPRKKRAILPS
jgi:hypothetical protein